MAEKELGKFKLFIGRLCLNRHKMLFVFCAPAVLISFLLLLVASFLENFTLYVASIILYVASIIFTSLVLCFATRTYEWKQQTPEYKFEKAIKKAKGIIQNAPAEASAKINALIADAESTKNKDKLADWLEKYNWLVIEKRKVADIKKKYRGIFTRLTKIRNVETELGISKEN